MLKTDRSRPGRVLRRHILRPAGVILALFLLAALLAAPEGGVRAATSSELNNELESTQQEIEEAGQKIKEAEERRADALQAILDLDRQVDELQDKLEEVTAARDKAASALEQTRGEMDEVARQLGAKRDELARAESDLREAQALLEARAAGIYKMGRTGYLEMILEADRLTELFNRFHLLTLVLRQDKDLLEEIQVLRNRVEREKEELETQRERLALLEDRQADQKDELDRLVAEREQAYDEVVQARAEKEALARKAAEDKETWEERENELVAESRRIEQELSALAGSATSVQGTGEFVWPVKGRISSSFGYRTHPIYGVSKMHTGIDIAVSWGTGIEAADSGTVIFAGWRGGYGKAIMISHGNGLVSLYAHQSSLLVGKGETVARGQEIGRIGSTGYSTGPHLHFEVRVNGSLKNPMNYL